jgi:hypothetical protein
LKRPPAPLDPSHRCHRLNTEPGLNNTEPGLNNTEPGLNNTGSEQNNISKQNDTGNDVSAIRHCRLAAGW